MLDFGSDMEANPFRVPRRRTFTRRGGIFVCWANGITRTRAQSEAVDVEAITEMDRLKKKVDDLWRQFFRRAEGLMVALMRTT
jgi:hypothetical protein